MRYLTLSVALLAVACLLSFDACVLEVADDDDDVVVDDDTGDDDSTDDDTGDDDFADDDDAPPGFAIDFEDYALGALGAPWNVTALDGSSATVIELADGAPGQGLELVGGIEQGDRYTAEYEFADIFADMQISFDVRAEENAAFEIGVYDGADLQATMLLHPDNGEIQAWNGTNDSYPNCVGLPYLTWKKVTINLRHEGTYDIELNGQPTSCYGLGLETGGGAPFNRLVLSEITYDGWGGVVQFDNIVGEVQ